MNIYDTSNQSCPQPVITTKEALEKENQDFVVIANSNTSKENIIKFLTKNSVKFDIQDKEGIYTFTITPQNIVNQEINCTISTENKTIIFSADSIGKDEILGKKLVKAFIGALPKADLLPKKIFFINSGVLITTSEDTQMIDDLIALAQKGVEIYSCGLCLEHYNIKENLKVGAIGNGLDTLNSMLKSDNTIVLG